MVCDKVVCEVCACEVIVCVTMCKMVCDEGVCEVMYVTDGMRQSCVLSLCM